MRIFIVVLATCLALAACGRRGALQPPPGAAATQQGSEQPGTAEKKPDPPFILDALI